jgi:hypothetical protein
MRKKTPWRTALGICSTAAALAACKGQEAAPPSPSGYPASPAARYALDARAALLVHARGATETDKDPSWRGCSGVLVNRDKRLALTSRACVVPHAPDSPILCFLPPASEPSRQVTTADVDALSATGHSRCSVQAEEPDLGLVVLRVEDPLPGEARAVELATQDPQVGDVVHGVFAPHWMTNTWFTGYVNNRLLWPLAGQGSSPQRTFGIATPVSPAVVGGMVLDDDGRLLGVMVATLSDTGIGIAVPASLIAERLAAHSGG